MSEPIQYPKRLIEVDLPIKRISAHARREKSIRHGHISTLHIWWARRPLAACRAVILAALWPDPADPLCPQRFRDEVTVQLSALRDKRGGRPRNWKNPKELRQGLLDFIADFANWDLSTDKDYLEVSRRLVQVAHESVGGEPGTRPLVVDPFAGGGAIPLEALRLGADAIANDLNPVAVLLNKVLLEDIPQHQSRLVDAIREWGLWIQRELPNRIARFYPKNDELKTIAYIFARTVLSEEPGGSIPVEIPLLRSPWLAKRRKGSYAIKWIRNAKGQIIFDVVKKTMPDGRELKIRRPKYEIIQVNDPSGLDRGTTIGGAAICPTSGFTTPVQSVRAQLKAKKGGTNDARLIAVVVEDGKGKSYRLPSQEDEAALNAAEQYLETQYKHESKKLDGEINHLRGFINIVLYGISKWSDAFSARQKVALLELCKLVAEVGDKLKGVAKNLSDAVIRCLAMAIDRQADYNSALCTWRADGEFIGHTFGQGQALPMRLDYVEVNPTSGSTGDWSSALEWVLRVCETNAAVISHPGHTSQSNACTLPLPDDSCELVCTDPPYYAAVPYADLSDFFYTWLRVSLSQVEPTFGRHLLTPKPDELVSLSHRAAMYREKDHHWFETRMAMASERARSIAKPHGLGVWVFANKETSAWEAMLAALISSGWVITASWPIDTEMEARLRARNSAALASSIHIVCRPRENPDGSVRTTDTGDFRSILAELPKRIHEWMPRLAEEGVVGADAIFACLGPALEIFSRYSRVEKASGEAVPLREYLEHVWAAVSKEALSMIFHDADTLGLEEDARLTAMWLWTLSISGDAEPVDSAEEDDTAEEEDDEGKGGKGKVSGFGLEFDAARKIAQGLGARLESLTHVVEVKKDKARLLPVTERAQHLFGKPEGAAAAAKRAAKKKQMSLFTEAAAEKESAGWGDLGEPTGASTVLDRVHQSMLLFASGRAEALKRFLVDDGVGRQAQFWKLAQSLSALYPSGSEEKRWVDGVLARKKGLGF